MPKVQNEWGDYVPILGNFAWAVISLSFFAGSFNVEIFRSGIEAVPRSTIEAAESLGYTRLKAYIHIVLPLAFRVCLPTLNKVEKGYDHDATPLKFKLPHLGLTIDMGAFHRYRQINRNSSFSVIG